MGRIDNLKADQLGFLRQTRQLGAQTPLKHTSVTNGQTRFIGAESLRVEGSERVTGTLYIDGSGIVDGTLAVNGIFDVNGPASIDGTLGVNGATTLNAGLTLGSSGRIYVGPITLDPVGSGGQLSSSGFLRLVSVNGLQVIGNGTVSGNWGVGGILTAGTKLFRIDHPGKPGHWLQHGATESPVSGIEYWGEGVVPASGKITVKLPSYFEALAKPEGRTVFVAGRGFAADWDDIADGKFVVRGPSGKKFSWLVKAERFGGDFEVELLAEEPRGVEFDAEVRDSSASDDLVVG